MYRDLGIHAHGFELGLNDFGDPLELCAILGPELERQRRAAFGTHAVGAHDPAGLIE